MKKLSISFFILLLSINSSFAYTLSEKDKIIVEKFNTVLQTVSEDKQIAFNQKLNEILPKIQYDYKYERVYYILLEVQKNLNSKSILDWLLDELDDNKAITQTRENTYEVIKIIDWDTIDILKDWNEIRIRLIWIDAPESTALRYWYIEEWANESTNKLKELIWNNKIILEYDEKQWKYDASWNLLAYIYVNWININKEMISLWYAQEDINWEYKYKEEFKKAQIEAIKNFRWLRGIIIEKEEENMTPTSIYVPSYYDFPFRIYYLWAKWLCYYINLDWNKVYVDKSYCN